MTHCQDHILTENIWFVWSTISYSWDKWRCHVAGQTTTWKDGATQLLICESLSFAISPEWLHLLKSTDSPKSPDSPESSDSPKSPDSPNLPKSHRLETVQIIQKLSGQSTNCENFWHFLFYICQCCDSPVLSRKFLRESCCLEFFGFFWLCSVIHFCFSLFIEEYEREMKKARDHGVGQFWSPFWSHICVS